MKLNEVKTNVTYKVFDQGDSKALMVIVEQSNGELNMYDLDATRMSVYSEESWHDLFERDEENNDEDERFTTSDGWVEVDMKPNDTLTEIATVYRIVNETFGKG